MIIRKEDLADILAEEKGLNKKEAKNLLDDVLEIVAGELAKGNEVNIHGFGKFEVKEHAARAGVSPKTGERIKIEAYKKIKFTPKKALKDRVN